MNESTSSQQHVVHLPAAAKREVFERYLDVTGTPSLRIDGDWMITWVNDAGRELFSKAGLDVGVRLTDEDLQLEPRFTARELETAAASPCVERDICMFDGRLWRMVMVPAASVVDEEDASGLFITCHEPVYDEGSRDEIQRLLRTLAYRCDEIDVIFDLIPTGIVMMTGEDPGAARVNASAAATLGVAGRRMLRTPCGDTQGVKIYRGKTEIDWRELPHSVAMETGAPVENQRLWIRRRDGTEAQLLGSAVPLFDDAGTVRGSVGVLVDVTELQEARHRSEQLARRSATTARLGLYALTQTDTEKLLRHFVRTTCRILDADAAAFFESDDTLRTSNLVFRTGRGWKHSLSGVSLPATRGSLARRVLAGGKALICTDLSRDEDGACPDALRRTGMRSLVAQRVSGEDGCFGMLAVFSRSAHAFRESDRPAIESAAATLAAALQRLEIERRLRDTEQRLAMAATEERMHRAERLASLGTLAAGISHEINNPLNSILVNAELGSTELRRGKDAEQVATRFQSIVSDVKRCGAITHNVLQFANPDQEQPMEHTRIADIVGRTGELVAAYLRRAGVKLETELPRDLPTVAVNATSIEQVLVNLLQNAAQVGAGTVKVCATVAGDMLELRIIDDGPGIPETDLRRIFHPFYSTKSSREGTGLGLSLVERIVHDHDGDVEARNTGDGGACFTLRLPLERNR